jgi:hypothetical protein
MVVFSRSFSSGQFISSLLFRTLRIARKARYESERGERRRVLQRNARFVRTRASNRHANRHFGLNEVESMDEHEFQRHFRMSRDAFDELLLLIAADLAVNEDMARRSSGSAISSMTRLVVTLRWLAVMSLRYITTRRYVVP